MNEFVQIFDVGGLPLRVVHYLRGMSTSSAFVGVFAPKLIITVQKNVSLVLVQLDRISLGLLCASYRPVLSLTEDMTLDS